MSDGSDLTKLVYLLWAPRRREPARNAELLLSSCAPKILEAGARGLVVTCQDAESRARWPGPGNPFEHLFCADVGLWLADQGDRGPIEEIFRSAGFRPAGYIVEESVYTDYGDNEHAPPRDWPDGLRSPGLVAVTVLKRPKRLPYDEWLRRWHGRMSPVSEQMQPRTRYVRNRVLERLSADAPPYDGIVEEAWPSRRHVENPFLFFGASGLVELGANLLLMLRTVTAFLDLWEIRTVTMSEHFVLTPPAEPRPE